MEHERSADIFNSRADGELMFDGLSSLSLPYIAPEILSGGVASKASDIWGLGCILFKMFFGVTPFATQVPSHVRNIYLTHTVLFITKSTYFLYHYSSFK